MKKICPQFPFGRSVTARRMRHLRTSEVRLEINFKLNGPEMEMYDSSKTSTMASIPWRGYLKPSLAFTSSLDGPVGSGELAQLATSTLLRSYWIFMTAAPRLSRKCLRYS